MTLLRHTLRISLTYKKHTNYSSILSHISRHSTKSIYNHVYKCIRKLLKCTVLKEQHYQTWKSELRTICSLCGSLSICFNSFQSYICKNEPLMSIIRWNEPMLNHSGHYLQVLAQKTQSILKNRSNSPLLRHFSSCMAILCILPCFR